MFTRKVEQKVVYLRYNKIPAYTENYFLLDLT
ncbi:MAG: hypothetical protein ACI9Y7_002907 [Dokdonia sp.]|jgi:hypothetical protein